jgi:hypothetical protein
MQSTIVHPRSRVLCLCVLAALSTGGPAYAATVHVTSCADDGGTGTLRSAIALAADGDSVTIASGVCSVITLTSQIAITSAQSNLSIVGPGTDRLLISAGRFDTPAQSHRVFSHAGTGTLTVSDVTIGDAVLSGIPAGSGGCIYSTGNIVLNTVVVSQCAVIPDATATGVARGGGIYAKGSVALTTSTISGNAVQNPNGATGGGIFAGAGLDTKLSKITGNTVVGDKSTGGGAYVVGGTVSVSQSTIAGNSAYYGGGIYATGTGNITISYSTMSENTAYSYAALAAFTSATGTAATINQSTISGNHSGNFTVFIGPATSLFNSTVVDNVTTVRNAGYFNPAVLSATSVTTFSSIFVNDTYGEVLSGEAAVFGSNNLIDQTSGRTFPADTLTTCPKLEALADNGGPTQTVALQSGSAGLNVGSATPGNFVFDQREDARNVDGVDIGAYERQSTAPPDDRIFRSNFSGRCL